VDVDFQNYMDPTTGPGRFALGSEFDIIEYFFEFGLFVYNNGVFDQFKDPQTGVVRMTKEQLNSIYGAEQIWLGVDQQYVKDGYNDYAERAYIWATTAFKISDSASFVINPNGEMYVENYYVEPFSSAPENFDFNGGSFFVNFGNNALMLAIDPSGLGETVVLNFTGQLAP
jgi:hypothetical protein